MKSPTLRTWIEIDVKALRHNVGEFFRIIPPTTKLMAVIKSNAYGHGLVAMARELVNTKGFTDKGWFGVDSIVEALRLRREGIMNPILVLGFTLPVRMEDAAREHISISISNFDALDAVHKMAVRPAIHLKLDTGMHRQGFLDRDTGRLITFMKKKRIVPEGIFTHFASAEDADYTLMQLVNFKKAVAQIEYAGFSNMIRHSAATGGTLLFPDAHLDMVRIGMGLYGYFPSQESKLAHAMNDKKVSGGASATTLLKPVLTWKTVVAEVKQIGKGSFVGYDLTEATHQATTIAVVPIGYWHGYDRGFSSQGYMLVRGKHARILGRVSMDMVVIDVTDIPMVRSGDEVVTIGTQGKETITAEDLGRIINTSAYEMLTRINPLIKRIVV